ncbi:tyrosine-protein phosphatase [Microbacterium sp. LWS13-1.2]|uniref:Tyrosine-protein phosphatase n=1 Tax=Microbacterium sp. LWS13-1.2 TaxID=3135264 RepID=A0AAU6SAY4_9MICO
MTITLDGLQNFRDLGGLPLAAGGSVRPGVLYRSESLSGLSDAGVAALSASPIGVVADFRTPMEQASAPDRLPADREVEVVELSVLEGALTGAAGEAATTDGPIDTGMAKKILAALPRLGELYVQMLEHGAASFAEAARRVAAPGLSEARQDVAAPQVPEAPRSAPVMAGEGAGTVNGHASAVLVHCTAGKDRTGVAVALLLDAVGVDREAIVADYAISERNLAGPWAERMLAGIEQMGAPLTPEIRELVTGTPPAAIEQALAWLDERGGSAAYLQSGGLADAELNALRGRLAG